MFTSRDLASRSVRLHADRTSGRHCHYRGIDRPSSCRPFRPRARPPGAAQCVNNMKQIGLGIANYESANGVLPIGSILNTGGPSPNCTQAVSGTAPVGFSMFTLILPQLEQQTIWNAINFNLAPGRPHLLRA